MSSNITKWTTYLFVISEPWCTLRGLKVIQKFNNDDNDNKDQYRCQ